MLMICGDTELTMLCAEAMGYNIEMRETPFTPRGSKTVFAGPYDSPQFGVWNPLSDDAQALTLVKKFSIRLIRITYTDGGSNQWSAAIGFDSHALDEDLNRAIVQCVAKWRAGSGWHEMNAALQPGNGDGAIDAGSGNGADRKSDLPPPVVAAFLLDYETIWQRAKEKAKRTIELRYPAEERDGREHEEHSLAVKFYAEMTKP